MAPGEYESRGGREVPLPTLDINGETVRAVSVGGLETCIELPAWKLCFDIGRCPPTATRLERVLFTHSHTDHMGGVVHHCATRDLMGMRPPEYVVPAEVHDAFDDMFDTWRRLDRSELPCRVRAARPGDRIELGHGRFAQAFRVYHRVPSLGYALGQVRRKLRPDLAGASRAEIIRLRQAGEAVDMPEEHIEVAFCGDTLIDVVDREEAVRTARLLILEVTFLDDRVSVDKARSKGHVHLDEVIERADLFENEALLFTHVSQRYSNAQMHRILRERLPDSLRDRVRILEREPPW